MSQTGRDAEGDHPDAGEQTSSALLSASRRRPLVCSVWHAGRVCSLFLVSWYPFFDVLLMIVVALLFVFAGIL